MMICTADECAEMERSETAGCTGLVSNSEGRRRRGYLR